MSLDRQLMITADRAKKSRSDGVVTEKVLGPDDATELVFGRFIIDPGVSLPAHVHTAHTIAYCVAGSCSFRVGDRLDTEFKIGPGDYVHIPAGVVHTEATGDQGVELVFARDRNGGETTVVDGTSKVDSASER